MWDDTPFQKIDAFLAEHKPVTPCLVMDLGIVDANYQNLANTLPTATIFYAVKANPAVEILRRLASLGSHFEVASVGELDRCIDAGIDPAHIAYTNTIKKRSDITAAYAAGVRLFAFDSSQDLENLVLHAPGADVIARVQFAPAGAKSPLGNKFGCSPAMAIDLLRQADKGGLHAAGLAFHVGSQQTDPQAWHAAIALAGELFNTLAADGIALRILDLGGGFPGTYTDDRPPLAAYGAAIETALQRHFPTARPTIVVEPGRGLVGDAGVIRSEVVAVTRKDYDEEHRWVYLDLGRYGGMAETEEEMITYRLRTSRDGEATGPVIIAGPTCDGDDVLYRRNRYRFPINLTQGDYVDFLSAGAYTATYATVFFNGFIPMQTYCLD